ncbi:gluconate 2-dehydrogenase subunit 3 family protein [Pedobacter gandavensis]|uniref:gluconate 2-dehydrogenase subunit 3 family protein n=1 Tax=Pedobacter gandavensis TaxID=2679963 RepID=UPI00292F90A9|nr:gluconate 2-dehydrogenase subunit 3 family protein [Pedobacter gandavensis]
MNRRDSLKVLGLTAVSSAILFDACKQGEPKVAATAEAGEHPGREEWEVLRDKTLMEETFFSPHEMATIAVLSDIIIPKDDKSGSATEAKVPEFIEFIVKDMPAHKTPMRGGLRWLDMQCLNRWEKPFKDLPQEQKIEMVDQIAYPKKAKPGMEQGVAFFNLMRSLTASGFYTTEMGVKDIGYVGNVPNKWEGVPTEIWKQYGFESNS